MIQILGVQQRIFVFLNAQRQLWNQIEDARIIINRKPFIHAFFS